MGVLLLVSLFSEAQSAPVSQENQTAVLFTIALANPKGLAIRAALDFGVIGLCITGIAAISPRLKSVSNQGVDKTVTLHAMQNPYHAFAAAVLTGVGINMAIDFFQSSIGAVQNWYNTPQNHKAILLSDF